MVTHTQMIEEIKAYLADEEEFEFDMSVSLPPGTGSGHRFYMPDILVYSDGAISHIIEVEEKTNTTTLFGKMALANRAMEILVREGEQPDDLKPNCRGRSLQLNRPPRKRRRTRSARPSPRRVPARRGHRHLQSKPRCRRAERHCCEFVSNKNPHLPLSVRRAQ